jgi:ADP-heptose:LPS heptosyltransferase
MNDRNRSINLARLKPLTDIDGVTFISLQKGPATEQIGAYFGRAPLVNLGPEIGDFGESAAVIDELDLMVSVDTSVGHVAGAIGKPAWVMLPYAPDWRWLRERADTPWYPSMRLFRPPAPKDWDSVINTVAEALRAGEWRR